MKVLATVLAEVFVGTRFLCHDSNTKAVLPDLANVALYEESGCVVGEIGRKYGIYVDRVFETLLDVVVNRWRAWILVKAANAADGLILFLDVFFPVTHSDYFEFCSCSLAVFALSTGTTPCSKSVLCCDRLFRRLRGQGSCRGRLVRRAPLVELSRIAICAA